MEQAKQDMANLENKVEEPKGGNEPAKRDVMKCFGLVIGMLDKHLREEEEREEDR